MNQKWSETG